jgi:hypothetical protein
MNFRGIGGITGAGGVIGCGGAWGAIGTGFGGGGAGGGLNRNGFRSDSLGSARLASSASNLTFKSSGAIASFAFDPDRPDLVRCAFCGGGAGTGVGHIQ